MRTEGFEGNSIFAGIKAAGMEEADKIADEVVADAKARCPVGNVIRFSKVKAYEQRSPGTLKNSIRKVRISEHPGNIRVYAGSYVAYYARFVEYGTIHSPGQSFMRSSFHRVEGQAVSRIEANIGTFLRSL